MRAPWRALIALVAAGVTVLAGATGASAASSTTALTTLQAQIAAAVAATNVPATTTPKLRAVEPFSSFSITSLLRHCTPSTFATTEPLCDFGDTTVTTTVVLYGNSEAQSWAPAFNVLGKRDHFKLIVIAKPACGTLLDSGYLNPKNEVAPTCYQFDEWAMKKIATLTPALLVIATTPGNVLKAGTNAKSFRADEPVPNDLIVSTPPSRTATDLDRFLSGVDVARSDVAVLGAIPDRFVVNPHLATPSACLLAHETSMKACLMETPTATNPWERALSDAASHAQVTLIDVGALTCLNGVCPLVVHGYLTHFNTIHLTGPFVAFIAPALGELLGAQLP